MTFDGMTVAEVSKIIGRPLHQTSAWLGDKGYRTPRGGILLRRVLRPDEIEDEINQRAAAAPPSAPCFRCGAREGCGHR